MVLETLERFPSTLGDNFTITTAICCLCQLNKMTKMPLSCRSSQVLCICSPTRTEFPHQPADVRRCSTQLPCDLLGQGMNQSKQAPLPHLSVFFCLVGWFVAWFGFVLFFVSFPKAKEHLLTEMLADWGRTQWYSFTAQALCYLYVYPEERGGL